MNICRRCVPWEHCSHAAVPDTGIDALQGATSILSALYAENRRYKSITSAVPGITHPYLNVGRIEGGTNTNVVPGKVVLKLDLPGANPEPVSQAFCVSASSQML